MQQTLALLEQNLSALLFQAIHRQEWQQTADQQYEEMTIDISPVINLCARLDDFSRGSAEEYKDEYLEIVSRSVDSFVQNEILSSDTTHQETLILGTRFTSHQGCRFTQALEAFVVLQRPAQTP